MKTMFDDQVRQELILRIGSLNKDLEAQWGKMNLFQMVKHNTYWNRWILGIDHPVYKQELIGKLFGKLGLKRMIKDEKPFDRNIPTSLPFKVKDTTGDLEAEKSKWISLTNEYSNFNNPDFIHDFFGKMTKDQIGILAYKHADHHLRQFRA